MEEVGGHYRRTLEIDDPHLSGENLVAVFFPFFTRIPILTG